MLYRVIVSEIVGGAWRVPIFRAVPETDRGRYDGLHPEYLTESDRGLIAIEAERFPDAEAAGARVRSLQARADRAFRDFLSA